MVIHPAQSGNHGKIAEHSSTPAQIGDSGSIAEHSSKWLTTCFKVGIALVIMVDSSRKTATSMASDDVALASGVCVAWSQPELVAKVFGI